MFAIALRFGPVEGIMHFHHDLERTVFQEADRHRFGKHRERVRACGRPCAVTQADALHRGKRVGPDRRRLRDTHAGETIGDFIGRRRAIHLDAAVDQRPEHGRRARPCPLDEQLVQAGTGRFDAMSADRATSSAASWKESASAFFTR